MSNRWRLGIGAAIAFVLGNLAVLSAQPTTLVCGRPVPGPGVRFLVLAEIDIHDAGGWDAAVQTCRDLGGVPIGVE